MQKTVSNSYYKGEPITIAFNADFLSEILKDLDCEKVIGLFSESSKAALFLPMEINVDSDILTLIMPQIVNSQSDEA